MRKPTPEGVRELAHTYRRVFGSEDGHTVMADMIAHARQSPETTRLGKQDVVMSILYLLYTPIEDLVEPYTNKEMNDA